MPFNIALTGIRAAAVDLEVTGNNIANASTVGFKESRAEFGDLYANGFLSAGTNPVGDGVRVQNVRQQFGQGNISFTDNGLDLAINGEGFFVLENSGERRYSRAGQFGVDKDGYIVNNTGMRLQGFQANDLGVLSGVLDDLVIDNGNLSPARTTQVDTLFNLDASEDILVERGNTISADGADVGMAVAGTTNGYTAQTVTITQFDGTTVDVDIPADSTAGAIAALFNNVENVDASALTQATIPAATYDNASGAMRVTIDGVPFDGYTNLTDLGNAINASPSLVGVSAILSGGDLVIIDSRGGDLQFNFASDTIALNSTTTSATIGFNSTPAATMPAAGFNNGSSNVDLTFDGSFGSVTFNTPDTDSLANLVAAINGDATLGGAGVTAALVGGDLELTNGSGAVITMTFAGDPGDTLDLDVADSFVVQGSDPSASTQLMNAANSQSVVGGEVTLTLDSGMTVASATSDIFSSFSGTPFVNNTFDPTDENTYNHATSTTIYDSLGNAHVMSTFFVKEAQTSGAPANLWSMYVLIDGEDVGDPLTTGGTPTRAAYSLVFNEDGTLNDTLSDDVLISNWTPLDADGNANGADGPLNVVNGGILPIPDPPTSSNFEIDIGEITQFGSAFSVNDLQQNGYTTGRLVGLDVGDDGSIFARFTNGESQLLGQVALADFNDVQGLAPVGDTTWVETFESGTPIIGTPGTASLGAIRASSLEESNVDLSDELVGLIIAQRNYQANAKTIETANTITQTIINLR